MGQTVNLECVSYGGNPLATITWYLFFIANKKKTKNFDYFRKQVLIIIFASDEKKTNKYSYLIGENSEF